jgi:hypothetical protein
MRRKLLALLQRHRHATRVHQQVGLGEEPGEEHPMPVLIGALSDEADEAVVVAQLPASGAKLAAQIALRLALRLQRTFLRDRQPGNGRGGPGLGDVAGLNDGPFEEVAQLRLQRCHEMPPRLRPNAPPGSAA